MLDTGCFQMRFCRVSQTDAGKTFRKTSEKLPQESE
jgi:hypothetical protein